MQDWTAGEREGTLERVLELANVARPVVVDEETESVLRDGVGSPRFEVQPLQNARGEQRNVLLAFAKRRQAQVDDVEAIEEVLAEASGLDQPREVAGGGSEQAARRAEWIRAVGGPNLARFERAKQTRLQIERKLGDLVEEERAGAAEQRRLDCEQPKSCASYCVGSEDVLHSMVLKGSEARGPFRWMVCATTLLPVPDSPTMRTGCVVKATLERMR